jgi:hypothetical protein
MTESDQMRHRVKVYYDESGEYEQGTGNLLNMSMGGCVAPLDRWKPFGEAWNAALAGEGLTSFHMTDFEAWKAPFDFKMPDGSRDKEKHNRLLNSLLDLMVEHVEHFAGFGNGNLVSSDRSSAHDLALEDCVLAAVTHAVHDLWDHYRRPIDLVFGKQQHFSYAKIMKYVELYDWGEGRGRIGSVSVDEPSRLPELQAADILAYEMAKVQRDRPTRYPFTRLREAAQARGIPMTLKWGPFTRLSDRVVARMNGESLT